MTLAPDLQAAQLAVPNASFELPVTDFADPFLDAWEKTPKPFWYDESGGFLWMQLTGVFKGLPEEEPEHIVNLDGDQALFLFAVPEVGIFQDQAVSEAFDVRFEVGQAYRLTVGAIGGLGNMQEGVTLSIGLYYRDDAGDRVTIRQTTVEHDVAVFLPEGPRRFVDFSVTVPPVAAEDPWAGRHVGIEFLSTVRPDLAGGYWDLDNVRLEALEAPRLRDATFADGAFRFVIESEPGLELEILRSSDAALPMSAWESRGTVSNPTGEVEYSDPAGDGTARFYRARQVP